jgi:hypothetical protein
MNMPTPETDEIDKLERKRNGEDYFPGKMRDHAKEMEQQRNEVLRQVENLKRDKELFDKVILMGLVLQPDPLTGFKRLISRESIIEALKL